VINGALLFTVQISLCGLLAILEQVGNRHIGIPYDFLCKIFFSLPVQDKSLYLKPFTNVY